MQRLAVSLTFGVVLVVAQLDAAPPTDPRALARIIGDPAALEIVPKTITLAAPRATQQILISGRYADGSLRDLTPFCRWKAVDPDLLDVSSSGLATGRADGATHLEVHVGGLRARIPVVIENSRQEQPLSFRREVMPVFSSAGCSDIRCHGAPSGKNGFRLSLWGFDPDLDYQQLTRDALGRRTNAFDPDTSLIMLKALGRVSHAGGRRFASNSRFAQLLRGWQAGGLRDDPSAPQLRSLTVVPNRRVLLSPGRWQQLAVRATFYDGHTADVTGLTTFSTTDLAVADVDRTGLVEFKRQGEVAILCRFLGEMTSVRLMHVASPPSDYRWPAPPENNYVDRHVFAKLKMLNIAPSGLCSDEQFIRRVYLDLCGVLPPPSEVKTFASAANPNKRALLIDQLLQRPEYADYWTKKWMDVLRVSRDSIQLAGAQAYHRWLRERIKNDGSFADVARDLLTSRGESYRDPETNYYCVAPTPAKITDPHYLQKDLGEATAQLFFGIRLTCAQCHNHPYERWTQDDYLGLAAFFTQVKRSRLGKAGPSGRPDRRQMAIELNFKSPDLAHEATGKPIAPHFPGERALGVGARQDRRQVLAQWLTQEDNPYFAKAVVNRIWFHLHGRGIVEPVDDFRDSNPAANEALLDALVKDFVVGGFRLKPLIRTIVNSRVYQLSAAANESNQNDPRYFSHQFARPLPAEVLLDAICNVTGAPIPFEITKDYIVGIPKGTVKLPLGTRAVQLPVNDIETLINSSGRYVRYELHPFLRTFGQPNRTQTCECDREQTFTRKHALELVVGPMMTARLSQPDNRLGQMLSKKQPNTEILDELYRRALSRSPAPSAAQALLQYVESSSDQRQAWEDVFWTILNSQEFVYQH